MRVSRLCLTAVLSAVTPPMVAAQAPLRIAYEFRADSPATHLGDVTVRVAGVLRDPTLIQLPAWYPGRYGIFDFAANVQEAHATCDGAPVAAPKLDKQTWVVRCPGVEELPYDAILAKVGLTLIRDDAAFHIVPATDAPAAVQRIGQAWLEGK